MAFYLVKAGGTAAGNSGRYTNLPGGSFASVGAAGYYPNVNTAIFGSTTTPATGDIIIVSNAHNTSTAGSPYWTLNQGVGIKIPIWSVDDSDMSQILAGAREDFGTVLNVVGSMEVRGFEINPASGLNPTTGCEQVVFIDCAISGNGSIPVNIAGMQLTFRDSTVNFVNGNSNSFSLSFGAELYMFGGAVTTNTPTGIVGLTNLGFAGGGGTLKMYGTDLEQVSGHLILNAGGSVVTEDIMSIEFHDCRLDAGVGWHNEALTDGTQYIEGFGCYTSTTGDQSEYAMHLSYYNGTIDAQTTIYRSETPTYPSGAQVALKIVGNANTDQSNAIEVKCLSMYLDLTDVASDTMRFHFASTSTLTDREVWAEIVYQNATTSTQYVYLSNRGNAVVTGTEHQDDSAASTWMNGAGDLVGYNEYYMDLDTSSIPGNANIVEIRFYDGSGGTTYLDPAPTGV